MKKFYTFLVVIFALISGVVFSACKDNYKFSMKFYLNNTSISELNLYIDENGDADSAQVEVKFTRIKSGKIDPIEISVDQPGIATISNKVKNGTTYTFAVSALAPTHDANITVHHLSSNKKASIKLNVEKRSSHIENLNKTYVVNIPSEGSRLVKIDAKQLLNYDGTEDVYFTLAAGANLPAGITPEYVTIDGNSVINAFNVTSGVTNGAQLSLNPVFTIPNYYTEIKNGNGVAENLVLNVNFLSLLGADAGKVGVSVNNSRASYQSDAYQAAYDASKPIVLLYNDENFNTLSVKFNYGINDIQNQLYKNYYKTPTLQTPAGQAVAGFGFSLGGSADSYLISASSVADVSQVMFAFEPNDKFVGEIETFNVGITLASKKRSTDVEVRKENELITADSSLSEETLDNVTLFDSYFDRSNNEILGAKFNFLPNGEDGGIAEFNYMRLTVPVGMLDVLTGGEGTNNVYLTHDFDEFGNETFSGNNLPTGTRKNAELLQVYLGSNPMRFYADERNGQLISELFTSADNIYIKYTQNLDSGNLTNDTLNIKIETVYKFVNSNFENDYSYFNYSTPRPNGGRTIKFNTEVGVKNVQLQMGYKAGAGINWYSQDFNQISINKQDTSTYAAKLLVEGVGDKTITNTNFNISISAQNGQENAVKISKGESGQAVTEIQYEYTSSSATDPNQFLYFKFVDVNLGYYILNITHKNGREYSVPIFIYEDVTTGDINYQMDLDNDLDLPNTDKAYDDEADYLVPADAQRKIAFYVLNSNKLNLNYYSTPNDETTATSFYSISLGLDMEYADGVQNTENRAAINFVTTSNFEINQLNSYHSIFGNFLTFKTNEAGEAGYFEGGKNYVVVSITLKNNFYFENIISSPQTSTDEGVSQQIKFYIYKRFNVEMASISSSKADVYFADYLAYDLKDNSKTTLTLGYAQTNDIWNYVDSIVWTCNRDAATENTFNMTDGLTQNVLDVQFSKHNDNANYVFTATITQFGTNYTRNFTINVKTPVLTTGLVVDGINYDYSGNFYIDLQLGQNRTLNYTLNSYANITHAGLETYIIKRGGATGNYEVSLSSVAVTVTCNTNNLDISAVSTDTNIGLLVVARDVIGDSLVGQYSTIDGFTQKFLNPEGVDVNPYLNAYKIIDLYITDGSEINPFIIDSQEDFENLNNENYTQHEYWFKLINNVSLSGLNAPISAFSGHLFSEAGYNFGFTDITLDDNLPNIFSTLNDGSTIKDINFEVGYNYLTTNQQNLGVIGMNLGELTDVCVNFSGRAILNSTANFGVLVGTNGTSGKISYNTAKTAANGTIVLSGGGAVNFGGLVGNNAGSITGFVLDTTEQQPQAPVQFVNSRNSGAIANVNVNSTLSNSDSAVGGLVGNNSGNISQVLVAGEINATYNVGGIIGKNQKDAAAAQIYVQVQTGGGNIINTITFNDSTFSVTNATSQVKVFGMQNVGGVVGYDSNGKYQNCAYQIFRANETSVSGTSAVGGFAGYSSNGWFNLCYVMSYRWNYSQLETIASNNNADIVGANNVAGFVGQSVSSWNEIKVNGTTSTENQTYALIILNSSANAFVQANGESAATVAGLTNAQGSENLSQRTAVSNAYFLGVLDGNINKETASGLVLVNYPNQNTSPVYGNVYSVYYDTQTSGNDLGKYPNEFNPSSTSGFDTDVWEYNANLNGGYIYLKGEGDGPLFELAPTSIAATTQDAENRDNRAYYFDEYNKVVYLNYYNFNIDANETNYQTVFNQLQTQYNTYSILKLFNFSCQPESIKVLQLTTNKDANCVEIVDDNLVVRGVGKAQITFTSLLNQSALDTVTVIVGYPFGENFVLRQAITSTVNLAELSVGKGQTKDVMAIFSGSKSIENNTAQNYTYQTSGQIKYIVTATKVDGDETADNVFETFVTNSLTVGGVKFASDNGIFTLTTSSLAVSVSDIYSGTIRLTVQPIMEVDLGENNTGIIRFNGTQSFNLKTLVGATGLNMQSKGGRVYPNTVLEGNNSFEVDILTDMEYTNLETDLTIRVFVDGHLLTFPAEIDIDNTIYLKDIIALAQSSNLAAGKQTLKYNIKFDQIDVLASEYIGDYDNSKPHLILFEFEINGVQNSVVFNLYPQEIYNINVRNYQVASLDDKTLVEQPILGQGEYGLIVVDMYPQNGYFDYLEIKDITAGADARINFVQVDANLNRNPFGVSTPTDDGLGIRLNKTNFAFDGFKIYALTQISDSQQEIEHSIQITAYDANGQIGYTTYEIQIRLLPEVSVDYLTPDRQVYLTAENGAESVPDDIAIGTPVMFRVNAANTSTLNASMNFEAGSELNINEYFTLSANNNNYYTLNCINPDAALIGRRISVKFTGTRLTNTGEELTTTTGFTLKIAWFKVFGVSIYGSNARVLNGEWQLIGNFNTPVDLEFYFAPTDVSYYKFPNTEFRCGDNNYVDESAVRIVDILKQLNGLQTTNQVDISQILTWYQTGEAGDEAVGESELSAENNAYGVQITRNANTVASVTVKNGYKVNKFTLAFNLGKDGNYPLVVQDTTGKAEFTLKGNLVFNQQTTDNALLVKNEADFYSMVGEQTDYILGVDLTFDETNPYTPFDLNIGKFDGNGHTITISAFNLPSGEQLNAGLFTNIAQNTVVQNLNVVYNLGNISAGNTRFMTSNEYTMGAPGALYDTINFGGIAVNNNGVITNCKVGGFAVFNQNNINVDAITQDEQGKNISPFNIGGLAYLNSSTAFITNSVSELKISAMANVGAFVHTNQGKITSSYYSAENGLENGVMYIYKTKPLLNANGEDIALNANSAAFVLNNSSGGLIDMCYVVSGRTSVNGSASKFIGNLSANNDYAGFVFNNNSTISNCYASISLIGLSDAQFVGFVYNNASGSIINAYSYINQGAQLDRPQCEFILPDQDKKGNLQHVYTIKQNAVTVENVEVIRTSLLAANSTLTKQAAADNFVGFSFGDVGNPSSVWQIDVVGNLFMPHLTATQETMTFGSLDSPNTQGTVTHYYGWKDIDLYEDGNTQTYSKNYGTKANPYIIYNVNSWNKLFADDGKDNYINGYYRLVADINFNKTMPLTSKWQFKGNLQGNGLIISNFALNTEENLDSIGLFSELAGEKNNYNNNVVRNLSIQNASIKAIKTQAVGLLAGRIENYKLYNLSVSSDGTLLGENVVGGLAGVISGHFDVEKISASTSAICDYELRSSSEDSLIVYLSTLNNNSYNNLSSVYYAGAVAGIVDAIPDGVGDVLTTRQTNAGYFIKDVRVEGNMLLMANTVGGAFGLINEYTNLQNVSVAGDETNEITLAGFQYSAGIVGENRGVINGATFECAYNDVFSTSRGTAAGIVGLNLGYINKATATFNALRLTGSINNYRNNTSVLAGLVGRNAEGYLLNSAFNGQILSAWSNSTEVTAGAIGTDYPIYNMEGSGVNQINSTVAKNVLNKFTYSDAPSMRVQDVTIKADAINFWLDNLNYAYLINQNELASVPFALSASRIIAAGVGIVTEQASEDELSTIPYNINYGFVSGGDFVINSTTPYAAVGTVGAIENAAMYDDKTCNTPYANVFNYSTKENKVYPLYAVGSYVRAFDSFSRANYSGDLMLLGGIANHTIEKVEGEGAIARIATNNSQAGNNLSYDLYYTGDIASINIQLFYLTEEQLSNTIFDGRNEHTFTIKTEATTITDKDNSYKLTLQFKKQA